MTRVWCFQEYHNQFSCWKYTYNRIESNLFAYDDRLKMNYAIFSYIYTPNVSQNKPNDSANPSQF